MTSGPEKRAIGARRTTSFEKAGAVQLCQGTILR
jgi:hypothetical protein